MKRRNIIIAAILVTGILMFPATRVQAGDINLSTGWNLKSALVTLDVPGTFGTDSTKYASVWKWSDNTWAVYLVSTDTGATSQYAQSKGFAALSTINSGEGFWVNVSSSTAQTVSVGGTPSNTPTISMAKGWNLKGLSASVPESITVAQVFGTDSTKYASVWKWVNNTWAVYLPGQDTQAYANSKGFDVLTTLALNEGFWVNVTASTAQEIDVEQPPPVAGKIIEMVGEDGFVPVSGVGAWKDGNKLDESDSQGLFSITVLEDDTVSFEKDGYVSYDYQVADAGKVLVFLKKADLSTTSLSKTSELPAKPAPKVLTSSQKDTWMVITGMNLEHDTTVALSRFKAAFEVGDRNHMNVPAGWKDYMVIGGADVFLADSDGNPTTNGAAGFSGNVRPTVSEIFGKLDFEGLKNLLDNEKAKIYLFYQKDAQWHMAGEATLRAKGSFNYVTSKNNVMDGLYPFIFVLTQVSDDDQFNKGTLTGQILDKETSNPIQDAFVFMVGNQTFTLTDATGNFSLPYKIIKTMKNTTIFAGTEGYYSAASKRKVADLAKAVSMEMNPFAVTSSIKGSLKAQGGSPISGGDIFLRFPTVLDDVNKKENGISIGFDLNATYKWQVFNDNDEEIYAVEKKGKYFLANIDSREILKVISGDGVYGLEVTVTHKQDGTTDFVESTLGSVTVSGTSLKYSLFPNFTFPSIMKVKSHSSGAYEFTTIPDEITPFLRIQAQAGGFKPSSLASLPSAQQGLITKDMSLTAKDPISEFTEGAEGDLSGWELLSDSSLVKWQQASNPEAIKVASGFLGSGSYPDEVFKDVVGTLSNINVHDTVTSATGTFKIAKGNVSFTDKTGFPKIISATLFDEDGDGKYDFVESNVEDQGYYVWTEALYPDLESGDEVMVSYPDLANTNIALLPAAGGSSYFWFGNIDNGTYNDPDGNNAVMNASLTSPEIDLTQYSNVTLVFDSWFEILYTGMPNPQLKVEIALRDDGKKEGDEIDIQSKEGDFKFKQGYFTEIYQANPMIKNYYNILIPPPSMPDTYTNYSSAGFHSIPKWKKYQFNLDPFVGHKIKIRFSVEFLNSPQNIYRGWGIDNIHFLDQKSAFDFAVLEPNSDFEPPTLSSVSVLEDEVEIDNAVNIVVTGEDDIWGIEKAVVHFKTIFGEEAGSKTLSYDSVSDSFKGARIFVEGEHGTYVIWKVTLEDYAGNAKDYLADTDYTADNFKVVDPDNEIPLPLF